MADPRVMEPELDVVDIFRRPEHVPPIIDDAIAIGARAVWMRCMATTHDMLRRRGLI